MRDMALQESCDFSHTRNSMDDTRVIVRQIRRNVNDSTSMFFCQFFWYVGTWRNVTDSTDMFFFSFFLACCNLCNLILLVTTLTGLNFCHNSSLFCVCVANANWP